MATNHKGTEKSPSTIHYKWTKVKRNLHKSNYVTSVLKVEVYSFPHETAIHKPHDVCTSVVNLQWFYAYIRTMSL